MRTSFQTWFIVVIVFAPPVLCGSEGLDPDVLKKTKAATVFLRVMTDGEEVQGSGFFCEGNLIVTNAHVVGMKHSKNPPQQISVIVNSGTATDEIQTTGTVVACDQAADLAFIKPVLDNKKQSPQPLSFSVGKSLTETTPVFIFGYPFGDALAGMQGNPAVTVGSGSVSSLRLDQSRLLDTIQINGDLNPGNSGGPIVTKTGDVVAVSVATVRGTQIGFAIPCDKVRRNLAGRVSDVSLSNAHKNGDEYEFDVLVTMLDPLNRTKSATFYGWTAEPNAKRPTDPKFKIAVHGAPGDGERLKFELHGVNTTFSSKIKRVIIPPGKEFWYQVGFKGEEQEENLIDAAASDITGNATELTPEALEHASDVPVKPEPDGTLKGTLVKESDGEQYIRVISQAESLKLPKNVLQLVSAPTGKVVYGIFDGMAAIKVFEPPTFKEIDEIPVASNPVGIWCDNKRIVVACDDSRVVTILDAESKKPIKSVTIKDEPELRPIRVIGPAPGDGGVMTLWQARNAAWWDNILYNVKENGEIHMLAKGAIDWCMPTHNGTRLFAQHNFRGSPSGFPQFIDLSTGKIINNMTSNLFGPHAGFSRDFGHCFQTADHFNLVLPTKKVDAKYTDQDWSYVATDDLTRFVFDFPGIAIAELPSANILVSWGNLYRDRQELTPQQYVFYANRFSGKVLRKVLISNGPMHPETFLSDCATPGVIFVPGHELLIAIDPKDKNKVFMIRCGPVQNSLPAVGLVVTNEPPTTAQIGKQLSFTPTFSKSGASKVAFKIKKPLQGMTIDPEKGTLTWIPTDAYLGKYEIQILAEIDDQVVLVLRWTLEIQP